MDEAHEGLAILRQYPCRKKQASSGGAAAAPTLGRSSAATIAREGAVVRIGAFLLVAGALHP